MAHDVTGRLTEYELVIRGRIGTRQQPAFDGFAVTSSGPDETHLHGWLPDQAALHGVLEQIRDLGLDLIGVHEIV